MTKSDAIFVFLVMISNTVTHKRQTVGKNFLNRYTQIASNTSHRESDDEKLVPYVVNAVVQSYLRRGKEASSSNNEGGMSDSFIDIEDKYK